MRYVDFKDGNLAPRETMPALVATGSTSKTNDGDNPSIPSEVNIFGMGPSNINKVAPKKSDPMVWE